MYTWTETRHSAHDKNTLALLAEGLKYFQNPLAKPYRKTHMCTKNILRKGSRLAIVFSKVVLGKRLWHEQVCKLCAQLALLLRIYTGSCSEAVFAPFAPLGGIRVVVYLSVL